VLGQSYDEKCDVFSFAILMVEVLHSKINPFGNHTMYCEVAMAKDPNFRPQINAEFTEQPHLKWLIDLIHKCWSHESADRPSFAQIMEVFNSHPV